jgi:hypothetical protein
MLLALPLRSARAQTAMAPNVKGGVGSGVVGGPSNGGGSAASKTPEPDQPKAQHSKSHSRSGHRAAAPSQKKAPAPTTNAEPFVDTTEHASLRNPELPSANKQAALAYGQLASAFEPNQGQVNPQVKFLTRGRGFSLFLTHDGAVLSMSASANSDSTAKERTSDQLAMRLDGANENVKPTGVNELAGKTNYFIGKDPANWRPNIPTYSDVKYKGVYPGVDLVYHGNQKELEYDFFVAPGADPRAIHLNIPAHGLKIDSNGDLMVKTEAGEVRFRKPTIYQLPTSRTTTSNEARVPVSGRYVLLAENEVGFKLSAYDHAKTLVIDPVLVYSTLAGGSQHDEARGIAVDSTGAAYISGWTSSSDFPISAGAYNGTFTGGGASNSDIFVTKLNPGGASIAYSTYIGGSEDDVADAIAIDANGNAYVTGETYSPNFPAVSAYQDDCSSTCSSSLSDAFLFALGPDGSALLYSTYFGGNGIDRGFGVAVSSASSVYVYGQTIANGQTENFPTTTGAYQTVYGGGNSDAFVADFNTTTSGTASLVYSTYLGGSGDEDYNGNSDNTRKGGIALDTSGDAWVTGFTTGSFPTTVGAYQTTFQGGGSVTHSDAFVTELNPAGTGLLYSTYFGGSGDDLAFGITVDSSNNVYITGSTSSPNLPVTSTAFQPACPTTCGTTFNGFVTVLSPTGTPTLHYSTYLAGTNNGTSIQDGGQAIAIDSSLNAYVTGGTAAINLVTTDPIQAANGGGNDAFVAELATTGSASTFPEIFSTYLGGSGDDFGQGIALDTSGNIYVTGYTNSTSTSPFFPTTPGAFQTGCGDLGTCNGKTDAFVAEINTANFSLTTTVTGNGSIASSPAGISCPGTCAFNFPTATAVTLTPTANSGSTFAGWTGACSGTGACSVTMNSDHTVGATFGAAFLLNVGEAGTGTGTVVDNVTPTPLINCQPNCTANYASGTVVTLTATPGPNSTFAEWSGACSGTGSCVVTMSQAQSVTGTFNLTAAAAASCPATGTDNWSGGAGNWSNSAMWSNGVPTATTSVCINSGVGGGDTVTADSQTPTSAALFIGARSTVIVGNNNQLTLNGNVTNLGLIQIDSTGAQTWLNIAGSITLAGGGQVTLTNTNAFIRRPSGTSVLTNVNNTISGVGDIGNNGVTLINQAAGVVNAKISGSILNIDAPSSTNSGLIEATGGGHLATTVTFNNAGGTFTAGASSIVELDNPADIQGGTLNGIGTFEGAGSTAQIDGTTQGPTTITGTFTIANNAQVNFLGTINNTGTIAVASTGAGTWMNVLGTVTLTGGGAVTLSNTNALIRRPSGTSILINVNNTISGLGDIGNNGMSLINQAAGTVNANISGSILSIDAPSVTNQGLIEASSGGILQVSVPVVNVGATIIAQAASTVNFLNGAQIQGGTINTGVGGVMQGVGSTPVLDGSTQGALTNLGNFTIQNNGQTNFLGTINNTGSITVDSTGAGTWMNIVGSVNLTGGGTVTLTNTNALIRRPSGTSVLTNVNNVISGQGDIGNNNLIFVNEPGGVVNANVATGTLSIDAASTTNRALLEATNGGILQIIDTVENGGANITAGAGSTVNLPNPAVIEGGTITVANGATFEGSNSTATLDGASQGPLTIVGTFTILNNAQTNFRGTIVNTGTIVVNSTGAGTWMNIVGPVTLTGGGSVTMGNTNALIRSPSGTSILTNVNNAISGSGDIGNNSLTFINQAAGLVNANTSGATLSIDAVNAVNQGVLESTGGGILQISVPVVNAGATITAGTASTVNFLNGSQIEGGTISTAAGSLPGTMVGVASTPVLDGSTQGTLTIAGTFQIQNNGQTNFMGTINNTGSIIVDSSGAGTWMNIVGTVTLTGGGSVVMTNGNSLIRRASTISVLTNVNNTISGLGDIGNNSLTFTNQGTVNADDAGGGTMQIDATPFTNQGLVEKTGSGVLNIVQPLSNSGVIFPNGSPVPGAITETQTYTQVAGGSLDIAIGTVNATTLNSVLNVTGAATLAGNLNVSLFGGFTPANGNSFTVLTASSISGQFASINAPVLPGGLAWSATYSPTSVMLTVAPGTSSDTLTVTELGTGNGEVSDPSGAIQCTEDNGVITPGSNCSASFAGGTVTLTAAPMGSPLSTFAGWGGACAFAGTSTTCMVPLTPTTSVTANFIAPPQSQTFNITPGVNVVSTAGFDCPNNPNPITPTNPCTAAQGPNAHSFEFSLPQVLQPFTMVVTATEFQANGLCPSGGSVTNPTDFDCRFATFFNYGTDTNGNTITPLCNPYANGNCVHYDIYYCVPQASGPCIPTPGQEPPPADYVNIVNLKITWNNDTFTPPSSTYAGSLPRLFDDPDYAFTPTSPFGTICGQPMTSGSTQEPYSCQFEFDVTSFFNPVEPVDAGIGGTIRQFNDLVVAFPPTSTGSNPIVTPPTPSAPTLSGSCVTGCSTNSNNVAFASGSGGVFQLTPTGYPAPTVTESGALPAGLVFNTETGVLSGTPAAGTGGNYPITLSASNGVGSPAVENLVIVIDQTPAITSNNSTTFTVGTSGSFQVVATGFPVATFNETGSLPSNVTLSSSGLLSGTPAAGTAGSYPITISATNGIGSGATQSFTLVVVAGSQAPTITSANNTTFTAGTNGLFQVAATGSPLPTFTESGALPSNVILASNGTLSGMPVAGTGGTYVITITASNGVLPNATQQFTLTVDQAPAITSTSTTTFTVGTNGSFQVAATGFPAAAFSETGALPSDVTLSPSGSLSGTPAAGTAGSYPITITASNGVGSNATQTFTLKVVTASQAPTITSPNNTTFTAGTNGTFQVAATGSPSPTFTETGALPSNVTLASNGTLSGTPVAGTGGTYVITITASNGVLPNATQQFTLTVDQAPAITSTNTTTFTVGTNGSFQVAATGFPAATFTQTGALPSNVTLSSTGLLSGIPVAGTAGSYPITIQASNGVGSAVSQSFTLKVVTASQSPSITSANNTTFTVGTNGTFQVVATGSPSPTFTETGALPSNVTLASNGTLSGTPVAGTGGTYVITITASNGVLPNATQRFTLTVDQPPAITSANSATFTVGIDGSFQVTASGFPASMFTENGTLPSNVTLSPGGLLSGTPAAGTNGSYPITITASNGVRPAAQQSFTLVVNAATSSTLSISPSSVNFGNVYAGTLGFRQVTLTNNGRSSITISNVEVTSGIQADIAISSSGNFIALSLCPRTLAAGRSCVVELSFFAKGSNYNPQSAQLVITDSAAGSPQTVPLTATIINPQAKLSANALSFSTQKVGTTSAPKSVIVTNTRTTNLVFSSITASGNFAVVPATTAVNTCTASVPVAPKSSCVISVTFTPTARGIRTGTLTLKDNVLLSPQVVVLTGIGN